MNFDEPHDTAVQKRVGRNVFSWRPRVSVVIPAYNVAGFIGETLESAIGQKYKDHEIIVVNDGSPDTEQLEGALNQYWQDIVYLKQPSLGAGAARNTAIHHSRGDLIAFLDGDDIWLPDFLVSQVAFLGRGYDMVYADAYQFGMPSVLRTTFMESAPSVGEVTVESLLNYSCNVITSGTVATRESLMRAGLFEHERNRAHDFHLWVRMAKTGAKIGYQQKQLLKYRVHLNSLSGDSVSRVEREIDVFKRVLNSIELDAAETAIVERQLAGLAADLHVEYGKAFLLNEDFNAAYKAFAEANRQRRSAKLTAIAWLARVAPRRLLRHYRTHRADEIAFVPKEVSR
jgi:glycosyltransferase involved in cell wall biosynthesis